MAIHKLRDGKIVKLDATTFANEKISETSDLQKYIVNSISVIDPNLFVISTEFCNWEDSKRRIDILCIDKDADFVVIELKRTIDGGHMELQSIRYSAMISKMTFDQTVEVYKKYLGKQNLDFENAERQILDFLEWEEEIEDDFGQDVKIILISADFSKEITTSVLWLNERELDIRCIRIRPQKDKGDLYFDIQQIIPLPEASDYLVKIREKVMEERNVRRQNKRAKSIITSLFDLGKLKKGDLVFLLPAIEQKQDRINSCAEIVNLDQNCLKRKNDDRLYSFSRLRKIIVSELHLENVRENWGFSIKSDWIVEDGRTLAQLLKEDFN
jgi:hypothetical protein